MITCSRPRFSRLEPAHETIGMTKEALQMRNAARVARAQAATSSFSLPLSPWVVITGLIGGLLLIVRKRE